MPRPRLARIVLSGRSVKLGSLGEKLVFRQLAEKLTGRFGDIR